MGTANILLLNANEEPLRVITLKRAIGLMLKESVDIVETYSNRLLRSAYTSQEFPCVLRMRRFINVPRRKSIWSRRAVFARDNWRCVYCGKFLAHQDCTLDHLIPKEICAKEGIPPNTFSNTVCACERDNLRKKNLRLEDSGLKFHDPNYIAKTPRTNYVVLSGQVPQEWRAYLEL